MLKAKSRKNWVRSPQIYLLIQKFNIKKSILIEKIEKNRDKNLKSLQRSNARARNFPVLYWERLSRHFFFVTFLYFKNRVQRVTANQYYIENAYPDNFSCPPSETRLYLILDLNFARLEILRVEIRRSAKKIRIRTKKIKNRQ